MRRSIRMLVACLVCLWGMAQAQSEGRLVAQPQTKVVIPIWSDDGTTVWPPAGRNVAIRTSVFVGAGSTADLQAAITDAPSGSVLHFSGSYTLTDTLKVVSKFDLTLDGNGATITQTVANKQIFNVTGGSRVAIKNFHLVGLGRDYVNSSVGVTGADLIRVTQSNDVKITGNTLVNFGESGVFFQRTGDLIVTGNVFIGPGSGVVPSGGNGNFCIYSYDAAASAYGEMLFSGNTFRDCGTGLFLGNDLSDIVVSENVFKNIVGQHGIYSYSTRTEVGNNIFSGVVGGAIVFRTNHNNAANVTDLNIHDNTIYGSVQAGIVVTGVDGSPHDIRRVTIHNNKINSSEQPIIVTPAANRIVADAVVSANEVLGASSAFGIKFVASGKVVDNTIKSTHMSGILVAGGPKEVKRNYVSDVGLGQVAGATNNSCVFVESNSESTIVNDNTFDVGTGKGVYALYASTNAAISYSGNVVPPPLAVDVSNAILRAQPIDLRVKSISVSDLPGRLIGATKASFLYIANGAATCVNAKGCWQVTSTSGVVSVTTASATTTQVLQLTPSTAELVILAFRLHTTIACTNAGGLSVDAIGDSTSAAYFGSVSYDLVPAISDTNIKNFAPAPGKLGGTLGQNYASVRLYSHGSVDATSPGCAFDIYVYSLSGRS